MADFSKTIDFIKSVYGNQEFTPLAVPVFAGNEKKYLNKCIDTTFVSSVGKFVDRFEEDMAKYTGAKKAVVCVSGTNALHMMRSCVHMQSISPPRRRFHTVGSCVTTILASTIVCQTSMLQWDAHSWRILTSM